jgi:hypothetical protein
MIKQCDCCDDIRRAEEELAHMEPKTEHYTHTELREAVGILLSYIDKTLPEGIHFHGQTPDWFVAAAVMSCNVEPNPERLKPIESLRELVDIDPVREEPTVTFEVT